MACMLQRRIVSLSADGIYVVTPTDLGSLAVASTNDAPIVIYHCAAGRIIDAVSLDERNHYVPVYFRDATERDRFTENVCGQCASPVECAREVVDLVTDRTRTKRQLGEPSEPTKCPLKGAKSHPAP
ncbi:hypothetical protein PC121_g19695 [Phytophthora cactorum]|nr:hypothetical protein PC121_g19695 [Phytophthora cactorum]KAG4044096.1 hypothetical protein PC123_g20439 [Phytophthora cactorum]